MGDGGGGAEPLLDLDLLGDASLAGRRADFSPPRSLRGPSLPLSPPPAALTPLGPPSPLDLPARRDVRSAPRGHTPPYEHALETDGARGDGYEDGDGDGDEDFLLRGPAQSRTVAARVRRARGEDIRKKREMLDSMRGARHSPADAPTSPSGTPTPFVRSETPNPRDSAPSVASDGRLDAPALRLPATAVGRSAVELARRRAAVAASQSPSADGNSGIPPLQTPTASSLARTPVGRSDALRPQPVPAMSQSRSAIGRPETPRPLAPAASSRSLADVGGSDTPQQSRSLASSATLQTAVGHPKPVLAMAAPSTRSTIAAAPSPASSSHGLHSGLLPSPAATARVATSMPFDSRPRAPVVARAAAPEAREECVFAAHGGMLMVFGGCNAVMATLGDTWVRDAGAAAWREIGGRGPGPRSGAASAADGVGRVYIYGGVDASGAPVDDPDVWMLDLSGARRDGEGWERLRLLPGAAAPAARVGVALTCGSDDALWLFGGSPRGRLADSTAELWRLVRAGAGSLRPELVPRAADSDAPAPRSHAVLASLFGVVVLIGGRMAFDETLGSGCDVWHLDLRQRRWACVERSVQLPWAHARLRAAAPDTGSVFLCEATLGLGQPLHLLEYRPATIAWRPVEPALPSGFPVGVLAFAASFGELYFFGASGAAGARNSAVAVVRLDAWPRAASSTAVPGTPGALTAASERIRQLEALLRARDFELEELRRHSAVGGDSSQSSVLYQRTVLEIVERVLARCEQPNPYIRHAN